MLGNAGWWPKANTGHPALTILTSQIIRCLFTMLTRGFISLSFLNSTSAYLGTWPISEKMREQCDLCEDTFLSASFLNCHMSKQHKESCECDESTNSPHVSCHRYEWTRRVAGPCSATCGGGVRAVVWVCGDTRADTYHKVGVGTARERCYNGFFSSGYDRKFMAHDQK